MAIGSVVASALDRFAGFSGERNAGASDSGALQNAIAGNANINNPGRVGSAWNTENDKGANASNDSKDKKRFDRNECHSCKNRKYQDGSNDPGVSFKSPTKMSPDQAATAVLGHEMEHVSRNQSAAKAEGREVISQSVTLQSAICPECGRTYIAGGETRTVTGERKSQETPFDVGKENPQTQSGQKLDAVA